MADWVEQGEEMGQGVVYRQLDPRMGRKRTLWATLIHLLEDGGGLEAGLCLSIDRFLNQCANVSQLSSSLPRYSIWALTKSLSPSQKNRTRSNSSGAPSASNLIVEILEVRCPIVNFHLLVLGVLSNATPSSIHGSPWVIQILSKESLELNPRQGSFNCLVPTLVLEPTKADPTTEEQSYK